MGDVRQVADGVRATHGGVTSTGTLQLMNHHMSFVIADDSADRSRTPEPGTTTPSRPSRPPPPRRSWIAYPMLCHCALRLTSVPGLSPSIRIRCRDFTFVTFTFGDDQAARDAFEFIKARTCKLPRVTDLFAFHRRRLDEERAVDGWNIYNPRAEFRRQGVAICGGGDGGDVAPDNSRGWRISTVNRDYGFCDTYPAVLAVPYAMSDNVLKYAREFRSMNRIPVLTYMHPINNCTITRSSQPKPGLFGKNNIQDEKLVAAAFSTGPELSSSDGGGSGGSGSSSSSSSSVNSPPLSQAEPADAAATATATATATASSSPPASQSSAADSAAENLQDEMTTITAMMMQTAPAPAAVAAMYDAKTGKRLIFGAQQSNTIVDARPFANAQANSLNKGGTENMNRYKFAKKIFLNIENIHYMRESLETVMSALKDADISPLALSKHRLDASGWLRHVQNILEGAAQVACQVGIQHSHVLIHCSDGWDRTSQLSALGQIMLDPYYRTMEGFMVLVEKDWLSFGHMFRLRSGHLNHENWFTVQRDTLAGYHQHNQYNHPAGTGAGAAAAGSAQSAEDDGQGQQGQGQGSDALQTALASVRDWWAEKRTEDRDGTAAPLPEDAAAATPKEQQHVGQQEATSLRNVSPVFHQFLDCVYQLQRQHRRRFEFNERFLRRLLYHLYSCQYGTFLFNSEKQRRDAGVDRRTASVWDYFLSRRPEFVNPEYDGGTIDDRDRDRARIILPNLKDVRWWHQVFNRTDEEMNAGLNAAATGTATAAESSVVAAAVVPVATTTQSQTPAGPPKSVTPQPAPLPHHPSRSVIDAEGEATTHVGVSLGGDMPPLRRSVSAEEVGRIASIRGVIAGGAREMMSSLGALGSSSGRGSPASAAAAAPAEQEMREMT